MRKSTFIFLVFCFLTSFQFSAQVISTIAGNGFNARRGFGGYSGDGGPATNAELYFPSDVIFDKSGNMYVAEGNSCVRKVDAVSGIITTIAGNGMLGTSGDGGPATDAELSYPTGLALDATGNIYIADIFNNEVRKVNLSTGIITLVAGNGYKALSNNGGYSGDGGPAKSAELRAPEGIAFDAGGNMYIADCDNNAIRKVSASTGIITTIAGNGLKGYTGDGGPAIDAELYGPSSLAIDSHNNIYIADRDNNEIRKISIPNGTITTVAGNNSHEGYGGDGGPATAAKLKGPRNISLDASGNMYIADFYNNVVRKVSVATGIINTVSWTGMKGFNKESAPADSAIFLQPACAVPDMRGNIYIADEGNNVIRKVKLGDGKMPGKQIALKNNSAGVVYNIQLLATPSKLPEGIVIAGTNKKASVEVSNGIYKYSTGNFSNFWDAVKCLKQLRAMGYDDLLISAVSVPDVAGKQSNPATDKKLSPTKYSILSDSIIYKVQLLVTRGGRLEEGVTVAGAHTGTSVNADNNSYRYATGSFTSFGDAANYENQLKAMGYTDAFISAEAREVIQPFNNPVAGVIYIH